MKTTVQSLRTHLRLFYVFIVFLSSTAVMTAQDAFITTWQVTSSDLSIEIPMNVAASGAYLYDIDFGDGNAFEDVVNITTHTYDGPGIYTVSISGEFPHFPMSSTDAANRAKLLSVEQWGSIEWESMSNMLSSCPNVVVNATDAPNLSQATSMAFMFANTPSFNQFIGHWNTANIEDMQGVFWGATQFNQPLNNWNVSNVTNMWRMFYQASSFNQPLDQWDVSNVTNNGQSNGMNEVFYQAASFDQDLSSWQFITPNLGGFLSYSGLSVDNYEAFLSHLTTIAPNYNYGGLGAHNLEYCDDSARTTLINLGTFTIIGDSQASNCEAYTLIPDANFEQALINLGHDDVIDGEVLTSNIENLTALFIQNSNISDLTGIEDFSALQYLWCNGNSITSLDVSQNTNLETLGCNNNAITSLNLGTNPNLDFLRCNNNMLTALDVSQTTNLTVIEAQNNQLNSLTIGQNSSLEKLWCFSNQLTALDVSEATSLNNFSCWGNQIESLDLSQNSNLQNVFCNDNQLTSLNIANGNNVGISNFDATNNNLTCIEVDDANYSTNNWSNIDGTAFFSEDCSPPSTLIPDPNFEQALIDLGLDNVIDGEVITSNISPVTTLDLNNKNISDLTGIEDFTALENLYCQHNALASLDLSQNTNLTSLDCYNNTLSTLDLSQNTNLSSLFTQNNNLTILDLSNNTGLVEVNCENNQLTTLDVKNGNNTNVTFFNATNNTNLTCIQVDDANYSASNWSNIDGTASFSEDCQIYTLIPDPNFEQALIDLGYDSYINGKVLTNNINTITSLDVANKNISDLTGIEDFAALENLVCYSNNLTSLNISQNTSLEVLECYNNTLNALDTSQNLSLTELNCSHNNLTNLDVSQNTNLEYIDCINNGLETLSVKNGNNLNFTGFDAYNNPNLVCIEVDDIDYAITNWSSAIDPVSSFSEDCDLFSECESYTIWNGSTWSNGFPDENSQAIINGIYTVTSDLEICELNIVVSGVLIVDEGVRLTINGSNSMTSHEDSALWVGGILEINGDVNNDGDIIFTSTATSTGQLASVPSGANILGNVEVQRYIPARRAFRFLSTAVNTSTSIQQNWQEGANNTGTSFPADNQNPNPSYGTHITGSTTGANGFDATISGNHSLFTLDNTAQAWETVQNTDTNTLLAGEAYRLYVRGDRSINPSDNNATPTNTTLRAVGSIQTGDFTINDLNQTVGGFNFIGNPYQAVVDMNQVIAASTNINPVYYYVWDPTLNTQGAYVTIELSSGTNASGSAANKYLQPGQAVFVQTLADGAAEITFKCAARRRRRRPPRG